MSQASLAQSSPEQPSPEQSSPEQSSPEQSSLAQSREILDVLTDVVKRAGAISHAIAARFDLTPPDLLALFKLEDPMPMKDLARLMACDASFITVIADSLEARGLVRREPGQRDRRVKNLVLTTEGIAARERLMTELAGRMPWRTGLDETERCCLAALLRKMLAGTSGESGATDDGHSGRPACS
jgi:DNA-binding MarR family transcriptional regulator